MIMSLATKVARACMHVGFLYAYAYNYMNIDDHLHVDYNIILCVN